MFPLKVAQISDYGLDGRSAQRSKTRHAARRNAIFNDSQQFGVRDLLNRGISGDVRGMFAAATIQSMAQGAA